MADLDTVLNALDRISKLGYPTTMLLIIYLGYRGVWIFGKERERERTLYDKLLLESREREDGWKDLALTGRELAQTGREVLRDVVAAKRK